MFGANENLDYLKTALLKEKTEQETVSRMTGRSSMTAMLRGVEFLYRKSYLEKFPVSHPTGNFK